MAKTAVSAPFPDDDDREDVSKFMPDSQDHTEEKSMAGYGDPTREKLSNGRSMSDLMRGGSRGLRGVIVGPSTAGGVPVNFNPHDRQKIEINIEPDGPGSHTVTLDQITVVNVEKAMAIAIKKYPAGDIDSIRERTAMAFEELAKIAKSNVQRTPIKTAARSMPRPPVPQDEESAIIEELETESQALAAAFPPMASPVEKIDRNYSPMAAFGLKKSPLPQTSTNHVAPSQQVGAPQKLVYFEKEGLGTVPAFYHDVIVSVSRDDPENYDYTGFMVLIYDLRFEQNAARWFPPSNDPYQRPWAAMLKGDQRLYLVQTTGFQYVYDNREYCILHVERAVLAANDEA